MKLIYLDPWGGRVVLTNSVLAKLWRKRQRHCWARERGGILYARFEGRETRIEEASGPLRATSAGRFHLRTSRAAERVDIREHYEQGLHFVGSWHTHPQAIPAPSAVDSARMVSNFTESRHDLKGFVLVIVGLEPFPRGLSVTVHTDKFFRLAAPLIES